MTTQTKKLIKIAKILYIIVCAVPLILYIVAYWERMEEQDLELFLAIQFFAQVMMIADYIFAFIFNALLAAERQFEKIAYGNRLLDVIFSDSRAVAGYIDLIGIPAIVYFAVIYDIDVMVVMVIAVIFEIINENISPKISEHFERKLL